MVAAAAGSRRRRCICCAAAMYILLVLPVVVLASSAAAAADGSFITWDDLSIPPAAAVQGAVGGGVKAASRGAPTRDLDTIVVSQDGTGHSRTVQGAVDMVPAGNRARVRILVRPGVYRCVALAAWLIARRPPPPRCLLCLNASTTASLLLEVTASALMGVLSDHDVCSIASLSSLPLGLVLAANFPNPFSVFFPLLLLHVLCSQFIQFSTRRSFPFFLSGFNKT